MLVVQERVAWYRSLLQLPAKDVEAALAGVFSGPRSGEVRSGPCRGGLCRPSPLIGVFICLLLEYPRSCSTHTVLGRFAMVSMRTVIFAQ